MWALSAASDQPIDLADDLLVSAAAQNAGSAQLHDPQLLKEKAEEYFRSADKDRRGFIKDHVAVRLLLRVCELAHLKMPNEAKILQALRTEATSSHDGALQLEEFTSFVKEMVGSALKHQRSQSEEAGGDPKAVHQLGEAGGLAKMVQHRCGSVQANGAPQQSLVTLGPGLAIALPPVQRNSRWAERDDGVRKLADVARGEAMRGKEESEHLLVLLGEAEADRGALARALLQRLVARAAARNGPAAEDALSQRVQLCVQLAAYFTHEAPAGATSATAEERAASAECFGRAIAAQQWSVCFDGAGHACGVRLELPYSPQTLQPSDVTHCGHALWLYAAAGELLGVKGRGAMRQAQTDGREALRALMARVGMAPVEQVPPPPPAGEVVLPPNDGDGPFPAPPLFPSHDEEGRALRAPLRVPSWPPPLLPPLPSPPGRC